MYGTGIAIWCGACFAQICKHKQFNKLCVVKLKQCSFVMFKFINAKQTKQWEPYTLFD